MLFVFDQALKVIHTTADPKDLIAGEVNEQINGEHSCNLTIPWTADTQVKFAEFNHVGFYLNNRFEVYKIRQTTDIKKGDAERDLYCEHLSYELSDSIVEDKRIDNGPARDIITRILADTGWEVGNIADLGNKTYNAYYITHREALYEIAELYGGELQFRIELDEEKKAIAHKHVDLLATRGEDTGIRFTFDRNLEEIQRDTDTLEIRTCLIGRGYSPETENGGQQRRIQFTDVIWRKADGYPVDKPAGQNWVGHPEAIAKYGMIKGVYEDESETPEQLLQNTWNILQKQCEKTQTYKAKLLFLQELMGDKKVLRLGDHFTIIDDEIGMTMNTRIIEIKYDLQDITNSEATMGQFYKTGGDDSDFEKLQTQIDNIRDTIGNIEIGDVSIDDGNFPNTVPPKSTVTTVGLFASIQIDWTYTNRTYYEYALYGSQTKGFAPAQQNLLYRGRGSSFLHSVQPDQTWYYRVCAYNSHNNRNEFSDEVTGYSAKIANAEDYMATASIGSALIGSLNADVINSGKIKAQHIEMKGVSVTDGNGKRTLDIDSFGNVNLDVASLKIKSSSVATESFVSNAKKDAIDSANNTLTETVANYYTKSETDSAISVAKDAIHLSVSQTYETKTEVENKLNDAQAIAKAMQDGKVLYPDATFKESYNGFSTYNNAFNDNVTIERVPKPYDCPTTSTHCIKIKHTGQGAPGHGGFCQIIYSRPNAVFIQKIIAKLPPGRRLMLANNPLGDGGTDRWLTSSVGTGNWEEYIRETRCGSTGTFSTGGHVYVSGGDTPSNSNPLEWYVASCTVVDITDVDDRVSILTGRINEAEQKITAEAITNTVKEHFYTKEETDAQITSQGYQTASEVQQTVDQLQIKFTQSGGYNFVRNGNAKNGQAYWNAYYLPEASWGIRNDEWTGYEPAIQIHAQNSTINTNAVYQIVDGLIIGETYTLSALVAGHRGSNRIIIVNGEGTAEIGWSDEAIDCLGGSDISGWKRVSGAFRATGSSCHVRLCHYNGWGNSLGWFKQIQINRGPIPLPYSPHPSEIYDGITTIDRDGIDVATSYGAHTQFHAGGMSSYNNSNQRTLGIENGGISFHSWNNNALSAYITQSSLWGGSQSSNGLAISTTANGTYLALGTSSLSDVNTTLNMDQALTISAGDSFQPKGLNFWKDVHAHGYGIRQLSHLQLAGSGAIQFDYLNNSPSTIYEAVDNGHSLYVMGGYQLHLGCMDGSGSPKGVIWMRDSKNTHSYTHWDFHNYTMYNMRTASTYANYDTRRISESYGVTSNVDGVRYLYKNVELVNGKAIRSIPLEYKGCEYDIVSIVCKGRGNAWVEREEENRFEINGDCKSVNIEIIIYPSEAVMTASTQQLEEAPTLELPKKTEPEEASLITNEAI